MNVDDWAFCVVEMIGPLSSCNNVNPWAQVRHQTHGPGVRHIVCSEFQFEPRRTNDPRVQQHGLAELVSRN